MDAFKTTVGAASGLSIGLAIGIIALVAVCCCSCLFLTALGQAIDADSVQQTIEAVPRD